MTFRGAGINVDHMHMGDLLRRGYDHPEAEIAAICDADPTRKAAAIDDFAIPGDRVFAAVAAATATGPDLVILCPATADHAQFVAQVAPFRANMLVEQPFASDLAGANRMIAACAAGGAMLAINWPLAWYPPHVATKRLIDEGTIGDVLGCISTTATSAQVRLRHRGQQGDAVVPRFRSARDPAAPRRPRGSRRARGSGRGAGPRAG
ncbi:Gfo/Idh/MocA family oxidoreductase [Roseisalinus antarcticus]|uniref:Putative oxidoreductase YteT n=1 Tax=Roseisalinus antarcticus TaxID=254357 RepID=A0A1Y5TJ04_9RHOB|nr:Gfo/Idh/MocA family oxidoreductase [Roseisalinus antarcticus]SLN61446.1 Putative oxidoreductase YteT precursor [Roseisalinus antarcticus]